MLFEKQSTYNECKSVKHQNDQVYKRTGQENLSSPQGALWIAHTLISCYPRMSGVITRQTQKLGMQIADSMYPSYDTEEKFDDILYLIALNQKLATLKLKIEKALRILTTRELKMARQFFSEKESAIDIAKKFSISRETLYRYIANIIAKFSVEINAIITEFEFEKIISDFKWIRGQSDKLAIKYAKKIV